MSEERVIVGLGEILWDVFPEGAKFGGAPVNFAAHCAGLGTRVEMVGAVGDDDLGRRALNELRQRHVGIDQVAVMTQPTGTVNVTVDDRGHPEYVFASDTAWDNLEWNADLAELAQRALVVCYGTLGQRSPVSRRTIRNFVAATPKDALRIFDVNLRQDFYSDEIIRESLVLADVLKLNDAELDAVAPSDEPDVLRRLRALLDQFNLEMIVYTRGAQGALLVSDSGSVDYEGVSVPVRDTVGAGDAFTAVVAIGMLKGMGMPDIAAWASRVAGYVCTQAGGTPELPEQLLTY